MTTKVSRPTDYRYVQFDARRSHITDAVAPWLSAVASQQQLARKEPPEMYLPARIGYNKWMNKRGDTTSYAPSARQVASLNTGYTQQDPYQPVPFHTMEQAAAPMNVFPRSTPSMNREYLGRNVVFRDNFVDAPTLHQIAEKFNSNWWENEDAIVTTDSRGMPGTYVVTVK